MLLEEFIRRVLYEKRWEDFDPTKGVYVDLAPGDFIDDDEEEPESKGRVETEEGEQLVSEKDDEVLCSSCFTLVSQKAIDEEQACPNCGADI